MTYQVISPAAHLQQFVRFFWVYEGDVPTDTSYVYRSMADGCAELVFHYRGEAFNELISEQPIERPTSLIRAQSQQYRRFVTQKNFGIFGVYLYPYTLSQALQVPSSDICNQLLSLDSLFGNEGRELEENVILAPGNARRVDIVSHFLEKKLNKQTVNDPPILASIRYIIHSKESLSVYQLSEKFNLSPRQFERKFKEYTGFSPKLYTRIIRFHATLNEYGNRHKSLTQIAYDCGYYDQSHFIHDFKAFSGYHPKHYFSGNPEGIDYRDV